MVKTKWWATSYLVKEAKRKGEKVVFTNGCFDLFHAGHVYLLHQAKMLGDFLVVGLNSDASIKKLKGKDRPVIPCLQREIIVLNIDGVDWTEVFDEETPEELIKTIQPNILVKGEDWKGKEIAGAQYAGKVVFVELFKDVSTSGIVERIKNA